jgi:TIR domain-containing protein
MAAPQTTVFISYRHEVSEGWAQAIYENLHSRGYDVFLDTRRSRGGKLDSTLVDEIAARPHFLVILEPGTLERCENPDDWVRREIECAIELKRNIVPILFNRVVPQ